MGDTFLFLQKLLQTTAGIPLYRLPGQQDVLSAFLQKHTHSVSDEDFAANAALWHPLFRLPGQQDTVYQWVAPGGITFLIYPDKTGGECIVFGPVLTAPFSGDSQHPSDFSRFCETLPVVESHKLHKTGQLVIGQLTGRTQPLRILPIDPPVPADTQPSFTQGEDIIQMRQVETRYEYSIALTEAVRQGNLSLALHIVSSYDPGKQTQVRNTNPLRNAQNYCIIMNTQLRHALEKSGIHPYRLDRLSSEVGIQIEQLTSTRQFPEFFRQVLQKYCRLVQEHTYPELKPLTHLAVTYIKEHLADNLTVKDTAAVLTVNADYLSTTFHRDMGVTFIDFVNRERTRQAAALLKHTDLQIQQIAGSVGYNNTSYFAKQFQRFYGVSPSKYRQ